MTRYWKTHPWKKDELEMLLEGRIPAELILTHDFMSLCKYLQINP